MLYTDKFLNSSLLNVCISIRQVVQLPINRVSPNMRQLFRQYWSNSTQVAPHVRNLLCVFLSNRSVSKIHINSYFYLCRSYLSIPCFPCVLFYTTRKWAVHCLSWLILLIDSIIKQVFLVEKRKYILWILLTQIVYKLP